MPKWNFIIDGAFFHKIKNRDIVLAILALWTVAASKPLLDVLGVSPEYWVANLIHRWVIVLLVLVLCVVVPVAFSIGIIALRRKKSIWIISSTVFSICFVILTAIAIYHSGSLVLGKRMTLLFGSLLSAGFALWLYMRFQGIRLFFSIMSIMALLVPISFLFVGPTKSLIFAPVDADENIKPIVTLDAPLIFIVFDEMSLASLLDEKGEIDYRLFPNFSRLAATSTWFKNASTNYGKTERAIPCLLSGKFQDEEAASVSYRQSPNNLFTLFDAPDGVFAMETLTHLCPPSICKVRNRRLLDVFKQTFADFILIYKNIMVPLRFASLIKPMPQRFEDLAGVNVGRDMINDGTGVTQKIDRFFGEGRYKSLVYLHFGFLPHAPYTRNAGGARYTLMQEYGMIGFDYKTHHWSKGAEFHTAQGFQRYLLQSMYADKLLGNIMDILSKEGLFDESTLVVTADHGVGFKAGCARRTHKIVECVLGENNSIPLFIKRKNQKTSVDNLKNIEFIDLLPTLLAQMGSDAEKVSKLGFDGRDANAKEERQVKVFGGNEYKKDLFPIALSSRQRLFEGINIERGIDGGWFPQIIKYRELIGMPAIGESTDSAVIEIENISVVSELGHVDKKSNFIPNFVEGRVRSGAVDTIAVSVNGVIADVVDVYSNEQRRFASIFDCGFLQTGANDIKFYSVKRDQSKKVLLKTLSTDLEYFELKGDSLVDATGKRLKQEQKRFVGAIDAFDSRWEGLIHISGWMADRSQWKPPLAFLLFYHGEQFISRTNVPRPDLIKICKNMEMCGFFAPINLKGKPFDKKQLKIFVILDNESYAEMEIKQGYQAAN